MRADGLIRRVILAHSSNVALSCCIVGAKSILAENRELFGVTIFQIPATISVTAEADFPKIGRSSLQEARNETIDTAEEVARWPLVDNSRIFPRSATELPSTPIIELGHAIIALVSGNLPHSPKPVLKRAKRGWMAPGFHIQGPGGFTIPSNDILEAELFRLHGTFHK